jgi:hypothetical protein
MASRAYRKPPQEPLSFNDTPKTLIHKAKEFCAQHNQAITDLMAKIDPETAKFDNFLLPVAHLNNDWICVIAGELEGSWLAGGQQEGLQYNGKAAG